MKKTGTYLIIIVLRFIALLPFPVLYFLSDLAYYILFYGIGYRRKVVFNNLTRSFPDKTADEIREISLNYYRHLCDLFFESAKMSRMSADDFRMRMKIRNFEEINRYFEVGRNVIALSSHYCNWEWQSFLSLYLRHHVIGAYKPLQNEKFDLFLNNIREQLGCEVVSMPVTLRRIIEAANRKELVFIWLAADQTPPWNHKFWTLFFNQEAMFFNGPAKIARRFRYPVFFQYTRKIDRGRYETGFELLFENPEEVDEHVIIKTYVERLESLIREKPEYYLWSHKRWKHKRPERLSLY